MIEPDGRLAALEAELAAMQDRTQALWLATMSALSAVNTLTSILRRSPSGNSSETGEVLKLVEMETNSVLNLLRDAIREAPDVG